MATEYQLTLCGDATKEDIAVRAIPDAAERPELTSSGRSLFADLYQQRALGLSIISGPVTYLNADSDAGAWEWEPAPYVGVDFRMDNDRLNDGQRSMLEIVGRLLASGTEDAALILDGNYLLLTRFDGVLRKPRRSWWDHYPYADKIIPG